MKCICEMVSPADCIADIGCDHAYVPIELVKSKKAKRAIAMDVGEGPLERAKEHIVKENLSGSVTTRLSDGFENFSDGDADAVVMSGIGGMLMIRILSAAVSENKLDSLKEMILSPQSDIEKVRRFLCENGFEISDERIVLEDGKYYFIMKVIHSNSDGKGLSDMEYAYGPILPAKGDELMSVYLKERRKHFAGILEKIKGSGNDRVAEIERELRLIDQAMSLSS